MTSEEIEKCITYGDYVPIMNWINSRKEKFSPNLLVDCHDMEKLVAEIKRLRNNLDAMTDHRENLRGTNMTEKELDELEKLAKKIANASSDDFGHSVTDMLEWVYQQSGNLADAITLSRQRCNEARRSYNQTHDSAANDFKIEKTQAVAKAALEHKP